MKEGLARIVFGSKGESIAIPSLPYLGQQAITRYPGVVSHSHWTILGFWRVNLKPMNLGQVVKPMINLKGGSFVGIDLSGSKTRSEENASCVSRYLAFYIQLDRCSLFIADVKLDILASNNADGCTSYSLRVWPVVEVGRLCNVFTHCNH